MGVGILAALLLAFATGRFTARPPAVHDETHSELATQLRAKLDVATAELVTLKTERASWEAKVATAEAHTTVVTRWRTLPGGGTEVSQEARADTRAEEHTQAGTKEAAAAQQTATATARRDVQLEERQTVVTLHTVEARPAWSVSLLAGGQLGGRRLLDALPSPLVVGVAVERRILGPVSAGLWATSGMAGGLSVRVDF